MKREIKILGAGISGLTAAINLAKAGYKVTVYERNSDCGQRFHEDFQGLENWSIEKDVLKELKEMNIKTNFKYHPSKRINVFDYEDDKFILDSKRNLFYLVKRGCAKDTLDSALKKQAIDLKVKILFNTTKKEEDVDIVATGPVKPTAIAKGISFEANHKNIFITQLNDKTSYKGYSYMFLINGHGIIVTVLAEHFRDANKEFEGVKNYFLKHYNLKLKNVQEWGGYGTFSLKGPYIKNRKLYVGEAAGLQDFFWGFGMRSSFVSGYLAAKSIIESKNYKKMIKERYSDYLKNSVVNRFIWEHLENKGYERMLELTKLEGTYYALCHIYHYSFFRRLLFPIAYHKLRKRGIYKINHKN